jgi:AbrB family looped-hinge helix DNA binding protein
MQLRTVMGRGGRVVIPAPYRKALGIKHGDPLFVRLEGNEIHILTSPEAIARAQAIVGRYVSRDRSLAKELLKERRAEAKRE